MSVPDPHYIALYQLQQLIIEDSLGVAAAGASVYFYQDSSRNTLKIIYELQGNYSSGYTFAPLANPVVLGAAGTFVDGSGTDIVVYVVPYLQTGTSPIAYDFATVDLYYVKVVAADGSTILDRGAVPANMQSAGASASVLSNAISTNEVANPQFVEVNFLPAASPGLTVSVTGSNIVTSIIPDWDIVTTGTGTVQVVQMPISAGPVPATAPYSNPPYALELISSGISALTLQQTFYASPTLLWGSFVNISFDAYLASGGSATITAVYQPSTGTAYTQAFTITGANYGHYQHTWTIAGTENTGTAPTGNVKLQLQMPTGVTILITSVQMAAVPASGSVPVYLQESTARQQDHLFHYWQSYIQNMPIPSLLTAWDFPLNPFQMGALNVGTTPIYIADQTIAACSSGTYVVTFANQAPIFTASAANTSMYVMQYLSDFQAAKMVYTAMSANIATGIIPASGSGSCRVYLFAGNGSSTIPTLPTTIGTIAANGVFTLTAANWTPILSNYFAAGTAQTISIASDADSTNYGANDLKFPGFNNYGSATTVIKNFAIVVTFSTGIIGSAFLLRSIGLTPGYIATRPGAQTQDEVLRECQYYYEVGDNSSALLATAASTVLYANAFGNQFRVPKRTDPTQANIRIKALDSGTADNVSFAYTSNGTSSSFGDAALTTFWHSAFFPGPQYSDIYGFYYLATSGTGLASGLTFPVSGVVAYTYIANAQLGVV